MQIYDLDPLSWCSAWMKHAVLSICPLPLTFQVFSGALEEWSWEEDVLGFPWQKHSLFTCSIWWGLTFFRVSQMITNCGQTPWRQTCRLPYRFRTHSNTAGRSFQVKYRNWQDLFNLKNVNRVYQWTLLCFTFLYCFLVKTCHSGDFQSVTMWFQWVLQGVLCCCLWVSGDY